MDMTALGRLLLVLGLLAAAVGGLLARGGRLPLGDLPGDLSGSRGGLSWSVPLGTCLVLSLILTVVLTIVIRR